MKHFRVQHLNLRKSWHISFLLVAKSEILFISLISNTAKIMELSTVNPKQSPVVALASPRLDTPRHENLPAQLPTLER